ncbi:sporadically distributed protein, TIGR04141 family [Vibrio parahaemolyticus]|uniref:TIGR04141 family sporadically distributed protein n=1 Tax=Vibrio parahaemolyticus TaxID=670 RepID=UPI000408AA5D|nr:TIGR04141 family sporadically distributed protein [Vibrio parahaemolyticus]OQJ92870.1 sporadically distributed protein, TIGR04141 family [Vibrio parahaemolyticus]OQS78397.1 sporadically distributed protein, TIGR04141 family [Vibrio parahaemolyticus]OQS97620.1 sporadically distributed protein, TIGR04141 family [Vibrio parahaemolyticus O4:K12 str. K1203]PNO26439.1 sporadically distributed protein, TIGR04141 family [Vibrio parahaemolyticus]
MASSKKIRKEKLSIYLARDSHKPISELIKLENVKRPIQLDLPDTELAELYIKIQPPKSVPPWTKIFTDSNQVESQEFGTSSNVGAVLVVRLTGSTFALSFGTGFHLIKQEAIERDFGLKVTLNSVDPDKLRSLDKASYDHNPLNSRTQSTRDVDIFNLHLDSESEMLYAITGTSKVELFGSHVTGRDALTIAVETDLANLPKILLESVQRYRAKLPAKFSWVEDINRVRDLDEVEVLDMELDRHFESGQYDGFWLGEPEVVDWESQVGYSFDMYQRTDRHVVLSLKDYIVFLGSTVPTVEAMKRHVVHVNNSEYQSVKSWPVYRCLYAEISYGSDQYILRNGIWYKVNQDFVARVDEYLESLSVHPYQFPIYSHDREEDYNQHVVENDSDFCLMDKKNIKIGGPYDKLEHCDLVRNGNEFIHVKLYRSSSTLSHLFSQGFVAAEAFIKDEWYRERLNPKLPESIKLQTPKERPDPSNYHVVYAIATKKNIPDELPFFSKVTLKNALKTLVALNYQISLAKIDVDPLLLVKKKYKPKSK